MSLNRLKNTANFVLGRVSAFFCGLFILLPGVFIAGGSVGLAAIAIANAKENESAVFLGRFLGHISNEIVVAYLNIAFARFLLRAMPPRLSGKPRFDAQIVPIVLGLILTLSLGAFLLRYIIINEVTRPGKLFGIGIIFIVPVFLWYRCVYIPVSTRHLKPYSFSNQPFILFLRRFSNFSDRAVMFLILRKATAEKPVVFLIPTRSRAGDWNPFLVGFTGMRLLNPIRSIPFIIKVSDDEWKQSVQSLIQQAQNIILDVSQTSEAIETEFQMIEQASCWYKTAFLKEKSAKAPDIVEEKLPVGVFQINYTRSWIRALPRLILGAVFMYYMWMFIMIVVIIVSAENSTVMSWGLIVTIALCIWIYFSFFFRPSIDRQSKQSIKNLLRGQQLRILATDVQNSTADSRISSANDEHR